jgi:hypothetical protein
VLWIIVGALLIGLTLGLLGSGGSILTVPVLVYMLGHQDKVAIAESLGIVGGIAAAAAVRYAMASSIDWRSVFLFGLPGMAGAFIGAWLSKPVPGAVQLMLFAGVMLAAAWLMFRGPLGAVETNDDIIPADEAPCAQPPPSIPSTQAVWQIGLQGLAVGTLTGLVGVGGGFLVVPALVLLGGLRMRLAVGTSLVIVALQAATGFGKHLGELSELNLQVDWKTIAWFWLFGIVGSLVGSHLSGRIDQRALKKGFSVFLVGMGVFVLSMEIPKLLTAESSDDSKTASENVNQGAAP